MKGNGGNTKPSSAQKVNIAPATAWMLSWPPVMMKTATLFLIRNKVAVFIITGGQDNIQAVAGAMFTFWAELGFVFPPFPFIAHSRGWDAEDRSEERRVGKECRSRWSPYH